jgi:hypothetical protein
MKISADNARFDQLQRHLLDEIVASIRDGLREAGVNDEHVLHEATGNVARAIAEIVDGDRVMNLDGNEVVPVLTFARERDGEELIGADSGGSWMHGYVMAAVVELFENGDDDEFDESIDLWSEDEH